MIDATTAREKSETVELSASYNIPIALVLLGIPFLALQIWLSLAISIFGLFLMFQAVRLKLVFTPTALDIYAGDRLIRNFPYSEWQNWRIFWSPIPILFYFKEVKSIHFLPIIFDPQSLQRCLETYCPLDRPQKP